MSKPQGVCKWGFIGENYRHKQIRARDFDMERLMEVFPDEKTASSSRILFKVIEMNRKI